MNTLIKKIGNATGIDLRDHNACIEFWPTVDGSYNYSILDFNQVKELVIVLQQWLKENENLEDFEKEKESIWGIKSNTESIK